MRSPLENTLEAYATLGVCDTRSARSAKQHRRLALILCRIVEGDIDLASMCLGEHKSFAALSRKGDSLSHRPVLITAVPFAIQHLPIVHLEHVTCRRGAENRPQKRLLLRFHAVCAEDNEGKRRNNQNLDASKNHGETNVSLILIESTLQRAALDEAAIAIACGRGLVKLD